MPSLAPDHKGLSSDNEQDVLSTPVKARPLGWREAALRDVHPLSDRAFRIRRAPQSDAEKEYWSREFERLSPTIPEDQPEESVVETSALLGMCFDLDAECACACAALDRPHELIGCGLQPAHFFDPALGHLYGICEALHRKEAVKRPYSRWPEAAPPGSWWRTHWEGEGRPLFLALLQEYWEADAKEAAAAVLEMARARGIA